MITSTTSTSMNNNAPSAAGGTAGISPTGNNNSSPPSSTTTTTPAAAATVAVEEALRQEITLLKSQLRKVSTEKYRYEQTFRSIQDRVRSDVESSLYLQAQSYEARLTELHSVIGVLKRRVEDAEGRRIQEVDESEQRSVTGTTMGTTVADEEDDDDDEAEPEPEPDGVNDDDPDHENEGRDDNDQSCFGETSVDVDVPAAAAARRTATSDPNSTKNRNRAGGGVLIDPSSTPTRSSSSTAAAAGTGTSCKKAPAPAPASVQHVQAGQARTVRAGSPRPPGAPDLAQFHAEIQKIRTEHLRIKHSLRDKERELAASRWTIQNLNQEKNYMQDKIKELEHSLNRVAVARQRQQSPNAKGRLEPAREAEFASKQASKVQLPRNSKARQQQKENQAPLGAATPAITLSGPQAVSIANTLNNNNNPARVARVLTDQIQLEAQKAEMEVIERERNAEAALERGLEIERLHYALQNALAENEVLALNLQEGKDVAESLTLLVGKYESRFVTMELLNEYNSQLIESYDVLVALLESELGQLLANCRAVGIGGGGAGAGSASTADSCCSSGIGSSASPIESHDGSHELLEIATLLQRANENRAVAESAAASLLGRMIGDGGGGGDGVPAATTGMGVAPERCGSVELYENPLSSPEDESPGVDPGWGDTMSSTQSHSTSESLINNPPSVCTTNTNTQTNAANGGQVHAPSSTATVIQHPFTKSELDKQTESRVRSLIIQLKTRQESLRSTLQETAAPSWSVGDLCVGRDSKPIEGGHSIESRRNDLEIAILMQELMALKEERAELRSQVVYMEKERRRVQVAMERMNLKEIGYQAQIQLLTSQASASAAAATDDNGNVSNTKQKTNGPGPQIAQLIKTINQLNESQFHTEQEYKAQLAEVGSANRNLIQSLQSSKSRYEKRVRKLEEQIVAIMERHVEQIHDYKDTIRRLENMGAVGR